VYLPRVKGVEVDVSLYPHPIHILVKWMISIEQYRKWQESELKWVVPVSLDPKPSISQKFYGSMFPSNQLLTGSIMAGWNAFLYVLWQFSSLNLLWSVVAGVSVSESSGCEQAARLGDP
jgi:hypothetical protein